jgi:hypothetical protein
MFDRTGCAWQNKEKAYEYLSKILQHALFGYLLVDRRGKPGNPVLLLPVVSAGRGF